MVWYKNKSRENQKLRACILYDGCTCILLTVWDKLLNPFLKELSVWYMCTDVNMKNQIGIKLTTTSLSTAEECATADKLQVNWESVDIEFFEQHRVDSEKVMHSTICCPETLITTVGVYK